MSAAIAPSRRGAMSGLEFRSLPVIHGRPATPVLDGGRIVLPAGEFAQIANGEEARFIAYLEFLVGPGRSRGNHVHSRRTETVYVIRGRIRGCWAEVASGEREERVLKAGDRVRVPPGWAHAYQALEYSQAIEHSDTPFDPEDVRPFAF